MRILTIAGLCAGLAVAPLAAQAADLVLYDAAGHPVATLVPMQAALLPDQDVGLPLAGLFAQQDVLLQRMMSDMQALQTGAISGLNPADVAPGMTVVMSSVSDGRSACSRTVSYQMRPGATPVVQVSQTGDGCGGAAAPAVTPRDTTPVAEPAIPTVRPHPGPRLYQIDYRHPVTARPPTHG